MKKEILCAAAGIMFVAMCPLAQALPPAMADKQSDAAFVGDKEESADELLILDPKEILALDDQKLAEAYIDAVVEIQASNLFHTTSGFTPREYKKYKALLKYRLQLLVEIHRRKIEMPAEIK